VLIARREPSPLTACFCETQVDGEQHFTTLPPYRPLGHTVLRNQLIAANGFRGVGVPFYDWSNLDTLEKRVTYLSARLNKWGIGDVAEE